MTDHWLGSYLDAAIAVVQAQFTARRFETGTEVNTWSDCHGHMCIQ